MLVVALFTECGCALRVILGAERLSTGFRRRRTKWFSSFHLMASTEGLN